MFSSSEVMRTFTSETSAWFAQRCSSTRFPNSSAKTRVLLVYRLVDAAYERRSIALTSNLHPAGFDELMPKTLATGTVDRLLHHAHVLITDGVESYRLAQATAGKGVTPLAS